MSVLEVERKFAVGTDFVVPDLSRDGWWVADPETVELDATYYDTADLRLARAHITLRRRTGGKDAGWHLKLPAGGAREEVRRPLGRARTVPAELARLVLARTRGHALAPVVRLRTTRTLTTVSTADGVPLVEVADDEVVGERLGGTLAVTRWREVEAELLTAGRDEALAAVAKELHRAGATVSASASKLAQALGRPADDDGGATDGPGDDTAGAAVSAYLAEQVEALLAADPRVRREGDDAVHAMRVASRRLRSALRTFAPLLDAAALGDLEPELAWLAAVLGDARDLEVLRDRLAGELDELPVELVLGPVRARLLDEELGGGGLRAHAAAVEAMGGARYLTLLEALDTLVAAPPLTAAAAGPARAVLPGLLRRSWKRLDHRAARAVASADDRDLHDARKAAKRARYTAEAVEPVLGRRAGRLGEQAKEVQTVLGEHQDSVVARTLLRRLATTERQAFTYGLLYAGERRRGSASAAEFAALWSGIDHRAGRKLLAGLDRRAR